MTSQRQTDEFYLLNMIKLNLNLDQILLSARLVTLNEKRPPVSCGYYLALHLLLALLVYLEVLRGQKAAGTPSTPPPSPLTDKQFIN